MRTIIGFLIFFGCIWFGYNAIYEPGTIGHFMVSSYDSEGVIDKTVETDCIKFNTSDKTWSCKDVNTHKTYIFDTNIIIENIDK